MRLCGLGMNSSTGRSFGVCGSVFLPPLPVWWDPGPFQGHSPQPFSPRTSLCLGTGLGTHWGPDSFRQPLGTGHADGLTESVRGTLTNPVRIRGAQSPPAVPSRPRSSRPRTAGTLRGSAPGGAGSPSAAPSGTGVPGCPGHTNSVFVVGLHVALRPRPCAPSGPGWGGVSEHGEPGVVPAARPSRGTAPPPQLLAVL